MKKEKLIKELEEAVRTEETATTVFLEHIKAFSERLPIKGSFYKQFRKVMEYLITQNKKHKQICEEILSTIKKENQDVY